MYIFVHLSCVNMHVGIHKYCVYIMIMCYAVGVVIDSDDDYCISYIVTMVDVRSCTRPPRSPTHPPESTYCVYVLIMCCV